MFWIAGEGAAPRAPEQGECDADPTKETSRALFFSSDERARGEEQGGWECQPYGQMLGDAAQGQLCPANAWAALETATWHVSFRAACVHC